MTKIDPPAKILKKQPAAPPPPREARERDDGLLEKLFCSILTGIVSQAESADPNENGQDRHGFCDEDLDERDEYLISRSLALAILAEGKFLGEMKARQQFNAAV